MGEVIPRKAEAGPKLRQIFQHGTQIASKNKLRVFTALDGCADKGVEVIDVVGQATPLQPIAQRRTLLFGPGSPFVPRSQKPLLLAG